jgi:membrane-associated phospholipid phosphatase
MTYYSQEHVTASPVPTPSWRDGAWTKTFSAHRALYGLACLTYGASLLQCYWLGVPVTFSVMAFVSTTTLLMVLVIVLCQLMAELLRLWRKRADNPGRAIILKLFNDILTPARVSNGFHALLTTGIFAVGFTTIKSNIPLTVPFVWDEPLMRLDRLLHLGALPHEVLAPLYSFSLLIFILNVVYNLWFFLLLGFFIWQGLRANDSPLRQRYLLSYVLTWGLGTLVLGTIFASAGPCFYGFLVPGADPYAGLMRDLAEVNESYKLWAVETQHMLWSIYSSSNGTVSGISAMPSMHVASSVLFLLCARAAGIRWLTWLCGFVAVVIFIGSVVLGWHYAVDGYAGALVALACWKATGWWVARNPVSSRPSSVPR